VPESQLLSDAYLRDRRTLMNPFPTRMPSVVPPGNPLAFPPSLPSTEAEAEAGHTTHFSIIDKYGNVVSFTTTLADSFGSGITVPGYGFLLNDSLRLFNRIPTGGPNDAGSNKRPMGSMTPVVIIKEGEPLAATGTYGSTFIPSIVLNVVVDVIDHRMPLQQAVDASRLWITQSMGAYAWNSGRRGAPSFSLVEIDALRDLGPPRPMRVPSARDEIFGSLASVGVDLNTFELHSAADDQRLADATASVVQR
jgi:gamma-glutamyltranspeptidase/glutathione hydrolase